MSLSYFWLEGRKGEGWTKPEAGQPAYGGRPGPRRYPRTSLPQELKTLKAKSAEQKKYPEQNSSSLPGEKPAFFLLSELSVCSPALLRPCGSQRDTQAKSNAALEAEHSQRDTMHKDPLPRLERLPFLLFLFGKPNAVRFLPATKERGRSPRGRGGGLKSGKATNFAAQKLSCATRRHASRFASQSSLNRGQKNFSLPPLSLATTRVRRAQKGPAERLWNDNPRSN